MSKYVSCCQRARKGIVRLSTLKDVWEWCVCGGGPQVLVCYAIFVPNSFVTYHSLSLVLTTLSLSRERVRWCTHCTARRERREQSLSSSTVALILPFSPLTVVQRRERVEFASSHQLSIALSLSLSCTVTTLPF
jgi:hypothetical protein